MLYAPGGGHGHEVRARALGEALAARGVDVCLVVPSREPASEERATDERLVGRLATRRLPPVRSRESLRRALRAVITTESPDAWISDTFPAGPTGELDAITLPPALLLARFHRDAHAPGYLTAAARYRAILDLEPHLGWAAPGAIAVGPITRVAAPDAPRASVDLLLVADDAPTEALLDRVETSATREGLCVAFARGGRLHAPWGVEDAHPALLDRVAPRALIGPAGFNLTYEALRLGLAHLALPRPRRFDDQHRRAAALGIDVRSPRELVFRLEEALARPTTRNGPVVHAPEHLAAHVLDALVSG